MKASRDMLAALFVAGAAITGIPAMTGCYVSGAPYVVAEAPPPPRHEVVVYRPGYLWVRGHWTRPGRSWVWRGGYHVRERPGMVYVDGHWARRGRGHVWVEGVWRPRRGTVVRRP